MPRQGMFVDCVRRSLAAIGRVWPRIWFQPSPPPPLEIARIGIGSAVFIHYAMATPFLFVFWGDSGWLPTDTALLYVNGPWMQSVHFYFTAPWQWAAFH